MTRFRKRSLIDDLEIPALELLLLVAEVHAEPDPVVWDLAASAHVTELPVAEATDASTGCGP